MRFTVPWRQLLFTEEALLTVRREKYRPTDPAVSFRDVRGGLSQYRLSDYKNAVRDTGLNVVAWETNYQLKNMLGGVLYPLSRVVSRIPLVGDYAVFSSFGVFSVDK